MSGVAITYTPTAMSGGAVPGGFTCWGLRTSV